MVKNISILGSTGSIGKQALEVADKCGFKVCALTANSNTDILEEQARKYKPLYVAMGDEKKGEELKIRLKDTPIKVYSGIEGICECAAAPESDAVLNSVVGMVGLKPTLAAIEAGKKIALANKETLVAGGRLVLEKAGEKNVDILPVDSEHSAIFQSLQGCKDEKQVKKLILTASGGPFFGKTKKELENVTLSDALNHPNWSMGSKITIDSATMMNKGLEIIEASWLFNMPPEKIDVVVHRQSVVHSLVEYADNSVIAQLGVPDMRIPIQYALTYPDRFESPVKELSLTKYGTLTFHEMDSETFILPELCKKALKAGGLYPAAVNWANEIANKMFRQGKTGFLKISEIVLNVLENAPKTGDDYKLEDIFEMNEWVEEYINTKLI